MSIFTDDNCSTFCSVLWNLLLHLHGKEDCELLFTYNKDKCELIFVAKNHWDIPKPDERITHNKLMGSYDYLHYHVKSNIDLVYESINSVPDVTLTKFISAQDFSQRCNKFYSGLGVAGENGIHKNELYFHNDILSIMIKNKPRDLIDTKFIKSSLAANINDIARHIRKTGYKINTLKNFQKDIITQLKINLSENDQIFIWKFFKDCNPEE